MFKIIVYFKYAPPWQAYLLFVLANLVKIPLHPDLSEIPAHVVA